MTPGAAEAERSFCNSLCPFFYFFFEREAENAAAGRTRGRPQPERSRCFERVLRSPFSCFSEAVERIVSELILTFVTGPALKLHNWRMTPARG